MCDHDSNKQPRIKRSSCAPDPTPLAYLYRDRLDCSAVLSFCSLCKNIPGIFFARFQRQRWTRRFISTPRVLYQEHTNHAPHRQNNHRKKLSDTRKRKSFACTSMISQQPLHACLGKSSSDMPFGGSTHLKNRSPG